MSTENFQTFLGESVVRNLSELFSENFRLFRKLSEYLFKSSQNIVSGVFSFFTECFSEYSNQSN